MLNENAQKWVEALRSGKYQQTIRRLHRVAKRDWVPNEPEGYCCLGVACELFDKENPGVLTRRLHDDGVESFNEVKGLPPALVIDWLGLYSDHSRNSLVKMNDRGKTFNEIADYIESEPVGLFRDA